MFHARSVLSQYSQFSGTVHDNCIPAEVNERDNVCFYESSKLIAQFESAATPAIC